MTIGGVNSMSGASVLMPKTSNIQTTSQNSINLLDTTSKNSGQTQTINANLSAEEMLKRLSENTQNPLSNISSNELLSLLQNSTQSNNTTNPNKTNSLMNNILSAYNDSDADDKSSYSAIA